jgi:hypothetical protein
MSTSGRRSLGWLEPSEFLWDLAREVLTPSQLARLASLSAPRVVCFRELVELDSELGGYGLHNVSDGLWPISERALWRPLQYCPKYFRMPADIEWLARVIVADCGLHLEELTRRVVGRRYGPLGHLLFRSRPAIVQAVGETVWGQLQRFATLYNLAKHDVDLPTSGDHLFTPQDARVAYLVSRCLAVRLYQPAGLSVRAPGR